MKYFAFSIGIVSALIGITILVLTIVHSLKNRTKNVFTGIAFIILGTVIVWLSLQDRGIYQINIGISDKQLGLMLFITVLGLFILKGVLDIREGTRKLQDNTISSFQVFRSKLQLVVAVIVTVFIVLILLVTLTQF